MGYVDLRRRRREESARSRRQSQRGAAPNPLVFLTAGFVLGALAPGVLNFMFFPVAGLLLSAAVAVVVAALLCYALRFLPRREPDANGPKLGSEKQLLMAIQASGGVTPVEAALQTSLTVDEAEELLTRFADRGHLVVEGRDGALLYALPGRPTGGTSRA